MGMKESANMVEDNPPVTIGIRFPLGVEQLVLVGYWSTAW